MVLIEYSQGGSINIIENSFYNGNHVREIRGGSNNGKYVLDIYLEGIDNPTSLKITRDDHIDLLDNPVFNPSGNFTGEIKISGKVIGISSTRHPVYFSDKVGIGTANPKSKLHIYGQVDGSFNGLVIDNRKKYGTNSGTNETSRILLSLSENNTANPLSRIFGIIEAGTISETDSSNGRLSFYTRQNGNAEEKMRITHNGKVGIGTTQPDMKLTVNGKIHAKEVKIDLAIPAPDYVFKSEYKLRSIEEVERFIKKHSHLPEIPSAKEFAENGVMQVEMDMNLLKKIEELTLYTIEQEKKLDVQQKEIEELKKQNSEIKELKALVHKLLKDKN